MRKVENTEITVLSHNDKDYISLTDMANGKQSEPVLGQAKWQSRAREENEIWLKDVRCMRSDG